MSAQAGHRARVGALLTGTQVSDATHTLIAGFTVSRSHLETLEASAIERACEVRFHAYRPLSGYNNPLDGRDLGERELVVRVGYLLTAEGGDAPLYDSLGGDSGASDDNSVEDRAESDAKLIRDVLGWQPNWSGLTPHVIDCAPAPDGDADLIWLPDRVIREIRFVLQTRASLPDASLAPAP